MADEIIRRDPNGVTVLAGITDNEAQEIRMVRVDEATGRIKISATGGGGSGDVTGPDSSTDNGITRFDGTTGKIIQNSTVTVDDTGNIANISNLNGNSIPAVTGEEFVLDSASQNLELKTLGTGTTFAVSPTINEGVKFTFNPSSTQAGINVGSWATVDRPTNPLSGDFGYNTTTGELEYVRQDSSFHEIVSADHAQTVTNKIWGSGTELGANLDGKGFDINALGNLEFNSSSLMELVLRNSAASPSFPYSLANIQWHAQVVGVGDFEFAAIEVDVTDNVDGNASADMIFSVRDGDAKENFIILNPSTESTPLTRTIKPLNIHETYLSFDTATTLPPNTGKSIHTTDDEMIFNVSSNDSYEFRVNGNETIRISGDDITGTVDAATSYSFRGECLPADDTGTVPLVEIRGQRTDGNPILNRPIFSIHDGNATILETQFNSPAMDWTFIATSRLFGVAEITQTGYGGLTTGPDFIRIDENNRIAFDHTGGNTPHYVSANADGIIIGVDNNLEFEFKANTLTLVGGKTVTGIASLQLTDDANLPSNSTTYIQKDANALHYNVPTNDEHRWQVNGVSYMFLSLAGGLDLHNRFQMSEGATVTPASTITLDTGNVYEVTASVTGIDFITTTDWQVGSVVTFFCDNISVGTVTFNHDTASPPANTLPIQLSGAGNFAMKGYDSLTLLRTNSYWVEISRTVIT